ncbi:malate synthase A [Tumebacillus sp. ITR2]|uniref:Malate synthase n=1 Tax=Tumebacillus amylolyticus TaxID=2801339 RepID=A0ABS1JEL5_9BACL|nr:malate synthase A [Tumebacillus amylolyticus]MBL0388655.1 malate synthase A [Tumebacillus amylolyticus]
MGHRAGVQGLTVVGPLDEGFDEVLTDEALQFVALLVHEFGGRREALLARRQERQAAFDRGEKPDFLPETAGIRAGDWKIAPVPKDLQDRRVEITGPAGDRKMVINALNSGARVFMADLEDANSPTWENSIRGQLNLRDAVSRTISFVNESGKRYALKEQTATLLVRPRGWHMVEKHVLLDGRPISASLFDFGLYLFHNRAELARHGTGPYFYLPKLESHLEARLWNDVFVRAQEALGMEQGTIKATVLIETILAAFETEEILYELRDHAAGLNCGRWDYIFSYVKKFRNQPDVILPDRAQVTMTSPFMRAYSLWTIHTCHKRGAHAIGGMAAQIPVKGDAAANEAAFANVRGDKEREARDGHDGTWVAHPGLVPVALAVFNEAMPTANQVHRLREDVQVTAADLLEVPSGTITEEGVRTNIRVGVQYLTAWLQGSGAVPLYHLMEDAATAEISRAQLWQWIRHPQGVLDDGRPITAEWVEQLIGEELAELDGDFEVAGTLFRELVFQEQFEEFLTGPGYAKL